MVDIGKGKQEERKGYLKEVMERRRKSYMLGI